MSSAPEYLVFPESFTYGTISVVFFNASVKTKESKTKQVYLFS